MVPTAQIHNPVHIQVRIVGTILFAIFFIYFHKALLVAADGQEAPTSEEQEAADPWNQYIEARQLLPFKSFKDVQIFHYSIPPETFLATWEFFANVSSHCYPQPVSIYFQHGSYPVANPDGSSFPRFMTVHQPTLQFIEIKSDSQPYYYEVQAPIEGDWFAVAFIHQDTERIAQKGLFFPCHVWLSSSLKIQRVDSVMSIVPGYHVDVSQKAGQHYFKFFADENAQKAHIYVTKCSRMPVAQKGMPDCPVLLYARPMALPFPNGNATAEDFTNCTLLYDTTTTGCSFEMIPASDGWNYIMIDSSVDVEYVLMLITEVCKNPAQRPELIANSSDRMTPVSKIHKLKSKLKMLMANDTNTASSVPGPSPESLYSSTVQPGPVPPNTSSCPIQQPLVRNTLPGNFAFEYVYPPDENGTTPAFFNLTNHAITRFRFHVNPMMDIGGTLAVELALPPFVNTTVHNISVSGCLQHNLVPNFVVGGECHSELQVHVNTSNIPNSLVGAILVPFPQSGNWYLSLQPNCYFHEHEGNESEVVNVQCEIASTSVILRVKSTPCILGQCGKYGRCYQYLSGGFLFSTCLCIAGWRGWGCTDESKAFSDTDLLVAVLLLTLSNLLFIPTIILALYRRYYTEALVYIATMFFSTFYHACDAEVYSFCLLRLSVLQFCDFYSAILSFWVTMIAMADLPESLRSLGHVGGAIGMALGVEYDRTGLWVFVVPVTIGFIILCISWVIHCYQQRACFPRKKLWGLCLLPGAILVILGLVLFAFLETRENYAYIHSAWHGTMALSVLFLLPERRYRKERTPTGVTQVQWKPYGSFKFLQDSETDML